MSLIWCDRCFSKVHSSPQILDFWFDVLTDWATNIMNLMTYFWNCSFYEIRSQHILGFLLRLRTVVCRFVYCHFIYRHLVYSHFVFLPILLVINEYAKSFTPSFCLEKYKTHTTHKDTFAHTHTHTHTHTHKYQYIYTQIPIYIYTQIPIYIYTQLPI